MIAWLAACCPREHPETPTLPAPAETPVEAFSFDRPPMLVVARWERLAAQRPRPEAVPVAEDDTPAELDETSDEAEIRRAIRVRRKGLATVEDLAGYLVRSMDKTPNGLHPTRALAQIRGPVRSCAKDSRDERRKARAAVVFARAELERCYAQRLVRDPCVIVKQPVGLVFEQAARLGLAELELDIDFRVTKQRAAVTGVHAIDAILYDEDIACLTDALGGLDPDAEGIDAQVPVVLWAQPEDGASPQAATLSLTAAAFGWLELERNSSEEALQLFEDAAWLYRIPEYQVLVGLAHERLGHRREAARAYRKYLDGRPGAPDSAVIEQRLRSL